MTEDEELPAPEDMTTDDFWAHIAHHHRVIHSYFTRQSLDKFPDDIVAAHRIDHAQKQGHEHKAVEP